MDDLIYTFNRYLKGIFGERVQRISLDAGFNCPNIDGTFSGEGCSYCNNRGFSHYFHKNKSLEEQIEDSIKFYGERLGAKKFIAYFQPLTNTYAHPEALRKKYEIIRKFPQIVGISISTRPDCIDERKLELISQYKKDYLVWIEYGLATTHNHLLKKINRNHTYEDFIRAYRLTRKYAINTGVHLILGLPSATYQEMIDDAARLASLDLQGIKFHLLHVLRGTALEGLYLEGGIKLLSKEEYVRIVCDFLEHLPCSFVVLRLVSTAKSDYLVAPLWINEKRKVIEEIKKELERRGTHQGCLLGHRCAQT